MNRSTSIVALVFSIAALAFSTFTYFRAERIAELRVQAKEKEIVEAVFPWFDAMFKDFGPDRYPYETKPETIAGLVEPMFNQAPIVGK
jgi:hypothetical protein